MSNDGAAGGGERFTSEEYIKNARILIVDDQVASICLLQSVLSRLGFTKIQSVSDSRDTFYTISDFQPDIILLDLNMPHLSGFDVLQQLGSVVPRDAYLPVLVLTADPTASAKRRALACGATDLLQKPFDSSEVFVRIRNLLKTRYLHLQVQNQNALLEQKVTERTKALQDALAELKEAQQQVLRQERLHAFSEMAGGVVHDFNNALMSVIGYSDLLLGTPELRENQETVTEFLQIMNTAGRDAAHVVGRLRDFYRPRDISDVFNSLNLNELVEQIVPITQPKWKDQALAHGSAISVDLDLEKIAAINANEAEMRSMLTNLIFNAVDAMPDGGKITLRTRRCDEGILLEVEDTGIGMTEEIRGRCLEPFFSTKEEKGTGLGLSTVFGIVKRHGGSLDIRSALGKGTTFTIRLPPLTGEATEKPESLMPERALKILFADDEPVTRDIVTRFLRMDGHEVTTVQDGTEALKAFKMQWFDLVLTDHGMPGMSGLQLATAVKELRPGLPVILLTGFGRSSLHGGETPPQVDSIISKPIPHLALRHAISEAMPPANIVPFNLTSPGKSG